MREGTTDLRNVSRSKNAFMSMNNSAVFGSSGRGGRRGREKNRGGREGGREGWTEGEGVLIVFDDLFVGWLCQV